MSASADDANAATTSSFVTALVLNSAIAGAEILAFTLLRRQFRSIYEPRTFIPSDEKKREAPLSPSLLGWPLRLFNSDPKIILEKNGLDAYAFVMYLRMIVQILLPIWLVSWVILMPVDAAGTSVSGKEGLDKFTFGNVAPTSYTRYAAHLLLAWIFTFWILWNLKTHMREWLTIRQRYLVSEDHSKLPQARTVLFTGIPKKYLDEEVLMQLFNHVPGGAKHIWLNRDLKEMPDHFNNRLNACKKLESAETKLIKTAYKLKNKAEKAAHKKNGQPLEDKWTKTPDLEADVSIAETLVPKKKRPSHRLKPFKWLPFGLPFMGEKVDTIEWCREEIVRTEKELQEAKQQLEKDIASPGLGEDEVYAPMNSAFVLFNQQIGAHMAVQSVTHNQPYTMNGRYIETAPEDVIWSNLSMNPYEANIRQYISYALTGGLILLWSFPVAFVGIISNVSTLCTQFSWLAWICKLPSVVVGIISGVLPTVLLAVLFMLLPIVLRLLAKFEGIPKKTGVELSLMTRYFIFLVIHGFLIVTLSSGLVASVSELASDISSAPTILASNLPKASTFFLSYITLQGLAGAAAGFLRISPLLVYYVKLFLLGSTPRSVYNIKYSMGSVNWGTLFPNMSLLAVITVGYMIISPIINGLGCFSFFLLYMVYKYLFTWVLDQPPSSDSGGLFFPKAVTHIFVGLYIQHICLAALFFLAQDQNGKASAIPEGALMVVLVVITIGYQIILNRSYASLKTALPLTLAHRSYGMVTEEGHDQSLGESDEQLDAIRTSTSDDQKPLTNAPFPGSGDVEAVRTPVGEIPPNTMELRTRPPNLEGNDKRKSHEDHSAIHEREDAFTHPAVKTGQQIVWVPRDNLGLGEEAVKEMRRMKIKASHHDTTVSEKGKVDITGPPPDEDSAQV
ncbi:Uncharacterized conserved protein [Phaffia rhodozyma]|uniref:Uncharacterized conserved protein n=1 Tax=Phaffia rhodozyma TaxID=264483 RepID=A0A0F7SK20_PHARH|nr:Uncharacterized conserved protein [Phaffia rhodozyma]